MNYEIASAPGETTVRFADQLVASDRAAFDGIVSEALAASPRTVVADLAGLGFMDSAGLGMLLTLRDAAEKSGASVRISQPKGAVRELLDLARFDTLFPIDRD